MYSVASIVLARKLFKIRKVCRFSRYAYNKDIDVTTLYKFQSLIRCSNMAFKISP